MARPAFSAKGKPVLHYMGTSTFSEYTVLPEIAVAKVNARAPLDKVCLLGCGITTGIGAVLKHRQGASGLLGCGVSGWGASACRWLQGAVMAKAGRIIAIDTNPEKFPMARSLGATDCINPKDQGVPVQQLIVDMTTVGSTTPSNASAM